ncbi:hypothetical protein SFRURICE_009112 [Spodoptera frugiperda]|nr:hypothetical protein SFRURICE_009112 [Spodoptera frugiperda]
MNEIEYDEEGYVDVNSLPLRPPQPMVPPERPVRRPWHPVMWDDSLNTMPPQEQRETDEVPRRWESPYITYAEAHRLKNPRGLIDFDPPEEMPQPQSREYPHKQRIRNLRRLIADGKVKPTPETLIFFLCNKFAVSDERQKKVVL